MKRRRVLTMEAAVRDIEVRYRRGHVVVDGDDSEAKDVGICHRFSSKLRKWTGVGGGGR